MNCSALFLAAVIPVDVSGVRPGPVAVQAHEQELRIRWSDERARPWSATFSLDPQKPLLESVSLADRKLLERARPLYWCETGKRRGGWDQFFDFPPGHPDGTRRFIADFTPRHLRAETRGDRLRVTIGGLRLGIFEGAIAYTFFPGSRLIQQEAVASTQEPDTAYFYDAGIQWTSDADRRPGGNMQSRIVYRDTADRLQWFTPPVASERVPLTVRNRMVAARLAAGSIAVFPPPHQYFFARDFTSNLGFLWAHSFRGQVGLGIRQHADEHWRFYPWMNAPPGSEQRMSLFVLLSDAEPEGVLDEALRYTNYDRFPALDGYRTLASHWHFAFTVQALEHGPHWIPSFKPILQAMGVDAVLIADFHGDGHPRDTTDLRLKELDAYFAACRRQSDSRFLIIPAEEANVHLGGHYVVAFPKPVYWIMSREPAQPFSEAHPTYGTVYRTRDAAEVFELVKRERGIVYQAHPRTKGSLGYPDRIREADYFRHPSFLGGGWKPMPSDLSSLRQGVRALNLLDDMNNWGLRKRLLPETDLFQLDPTHELYAHMNVSYVRLPALPVFAEYGQVLEAVARGDYFASTGEVLLPDVSLRLDDGSLTAEARVRWTFPLDHALLVWSDGSVTRRERMELLTTPAFGDRRFAFTIPAPGAKWARLEVWDIAGNGAFVNPVWKP